MRTVRSVGLLTGLPVLMVEVESLAITVVLLFTVSITQRNENER